jgi:ribonuclease P protein component
VTGNREENTFHRKERLRKRGEFEHLFKNGVRQSTGRYTVVAARNNMNRARFAVSARKKLGNAVQRNYERRLCREVFRREKKILKGFDVLVIVRRKTRDFHESYHTLKSQFHRCIDRNAGRK